VDIPIKQQGAVVVSALRAARYMASTIGK